MYDVGMQQAAFLQNVERHAALHGHMMAGAEHALKYLLEDRFCRNLLKSAATKREGRFISALHNRLDLSLGSMAMLRPEFWGAAGGDIEHTPELDRIILGAQRHIGHEEIPKPAYAVAALMALADNPDTAASRTLQQDGITKLSLYTAFMINRQGYSGRGLLPPPSPAAP